LDSRFNFRGSGKEGTCFQICLKQLRKALEIQGAISDFDLFWTSVIERLLERANSGEPIVEEGTLEARTGTLFLSILLLPVSSKAKRERGVYLFSAI